MKKIAFVIYRGWAYGIFQSILDFQQQHNTKFSIGALITTSDAEFEIEKDNPKTYIVNGSDNERISEILSENNIDVVFFYGWSWFVKEPILSKYTCLCLHPSRLPQYRGGSPIQNQIIDGVTDSAVSVFRMGKGVDDGDIYTQVPLELNGTLENIFDRIREAGIVVTKRFIDDLANDSIIFSKQEKLNENPPHKRRTPDQSELFVEHIKEITFKKLYDIVRALADPYPNAFLLLNGNKIVIHEVERESGVSEGGHLLNNHLQIERDVKCRLYVEVIDGYAEIKSYSII